MPLNFSLAGKTYEAAVATADPVAVERYAAASGDATPRYAAGPGQITSPLFPVVFGFPLMMMMTADPELGVGDPLMILHGEQEIVYHRPLRGGEELAVRPTLERVEDKGKSALFVAGMKAETPEGEAVVDQGWTIFVRGAGSGTDRPRSQDGPAPERGEVAARFTRHVDEDMPARYAEASGDHNPIHLDPQVAAAVGLPGVINHGLGSCSLVAGGLIDALFDGDATRLRRIGVRFTGMVTPGSDLATVVWQGEAGYAFETTAPDGAVVMTGTIQPREA
ncbi:MAG: MaoC family dehydratase N-terminal domain-containing protein [Acidimicrobiia bacterium]|nr:MaoC family dehydratase N-terminal domain-containing protein [Acidimicrobiia bacterium]